MISITEAAQMLGISPRHLWSLTSPRGPIPCVRLGRRVLYSVHDLRNFLRSAKGQLHRKSPPERGHDDEEQAVVRITAEAAGGAKRGHDDEDA
ncbi:MAG TPA: DNA-binding protein [Planctomycetes bacterium]|nr:DNA-binding protein [Planctomycetota bacterium]